jgi:hypothetical protein
LESTTATTIGYYKILGNYTALEIRRFDSVRAYVSFLGWEAPTKAQCKRLIEVLECLGFFCLSKNGKGRKRRIEEARKKKIRRDGVEVKNAQTKEILVNMTSNLILIIIIQYYEQYHG